MATVISLLDILLPLKAHVQFKIRKSISNWLIAVVILASVALNISYLESHGFPFKILIQMPPSSIDRAIWICVLVFFLSHEDVIIWSNP